MSNQGQETQDTFKKASITSISSSTSHPSSIISNGTSISSTVSSRSTSPAIVSLKSSLKDVEKLLQLSALTKELPPNAPLPLEKDLTLPKRPQETQKEDQQSQISQTDSETLQLSQSSFDNLEQGANMGSSLCIKSRQEPKIEQSQQPRNQSSLVQSQTQSTSTQQASPPTSQTKNQPTDNEKQPTVELQTIEHQTDPQSLNTQSTQIVNLPLLKEIQVDGRQTASVQTQTQRPFVVALHTVRISRTGFAIEPSELRYPEISGNLSVAQRRSSEVSFDLQQVGYQIIKLIRDFWAQPAFNKARNTFAATSIRSWITAAKLQQISEQVSLLCQRVGRIFSSESRIISVESPCIVLGDIHGNLHDLRTYERSLWPKAPVCLTGQYLFLGDYVDRGDYSVECVLYLFAMKLIAPHKFYLLRGNHEVASIQKQYTFKRECLIKFGIMGKSIWRQFNKVFDVMPLAAIIDEQIYCAHGGIPKSIADVRQLAKDIPTPLPNPEQQCPAAWEILWNDPITDSELIGMVEIEAAPPSHVVSTSPEENIFDTNATKTVQHSVSPPENPFPISPPPVPEQLSNASNSETNTDDNKTTTLKTTDASIPQVSSIIKATSQKVSSQPANPQDEEPYINSREKEDSQDQQQQPNNASTPNQEITKVPSDTSSIASTSYQEIIDDGFISNIKRGTGYLFSDKATNNFLELNNLSIVIRAHEVIPTGFAFHGEGKVITIFSSSRYCGLNNQSACALVDGNKVRILRLDTGFDSSFE